MGLKRTDDFRKDAVRIHCEQAYIVLSFDDRTKLRENLESGGANF